MKEEFKYYYNNQDVKRYYDASLAIRKGAGPFLKHVSSKCNYVLFDVEDMNGGRMFRFYFNVRQDSFKQYIEISKSNSLPERLFEMVKTAGEDQNFFTYSTGKFLDVLLELNSPSQEIRKEDLRKIKEMADTLSEMIAKTL